MGLTEKALKQFESWFYKLRVHQASGGPAKGTISAALVVLERLKSQYNLNIEAHRAPGESYSTAGRQLGRPGDFLVGDTTFHVTVAPMP